MKPEEPWYKDAICYELHVQAFYDSNADGIGDFAGARQKLDYLKDLGVTCIWLLPFSQSPLNFLFFCIGFSFLAQPSGLGD